MIKNSLRGFATMAALAILVICGGFSIFFLNMFTLGQESAARDALGESALQAAKAGAEVAAYRSMASGSCVNEVLALPGFEQFTVVLACSRVSTTESGAAVTIDRWVSTACSGAAGSACPGAPGPAYVERQVKIDIAL
jgi:hypothetical protein